MAGSISVRLKRPVGTTSEDRLLVIPERGVKLVEVRTWSLPVPWNSHSLYRPRHSGKLSVSRGIGNRAAWGNDVLASRLFPRRLPLLTNFFRRKPIKVHFIHSTGDRLRVGFADLRDGNAAGLDGVVDDRGRKVLGIG